MQASPRPVSRLIAQRDDEPFAELDDAQRGSQRLAQPQPVRPHLQIRQGQSSTASSTENASCIRAVSPSAAFNAPPDCRSTRRTGA